MRSLFIAGVLAVQLLACGAALGGVIVSQEVITGEQDYGSGNGQSFWLPNGETVHAVQIHIGSRGGSVRVDLWRTKRNNGDLERFGSSPVTSGTLWKSEVLGQTPGWFAVTLETPYENRGRDPEELVFDLELLTSGSSGWNEYSFSNLNSYPDGSRISWSGSQGRYVESSSEDLAFCILNSPIAAQIAMRPLEIEFTPAAPNRLASVEILVRETFPGFDYTLFESEDLTVPKEGWDPLGSPQEGFGGVINWGIGYGTQPPAHFFYLRVREIPVD